MDYIQRYLTSSLQRYLETFPAVLIWGPRQSGKSTLVHKELPQYAHFDLERPADYRLIASDPELFLQEHPRRICIDEAQRFPDLFPVLRYAIDRERENGRFVLLGSSGPLLLERSSETLAGRLGVLELTPFSAAELSATCPWKQRWFWGGLPPLYLLPSDEQRLLWLDSYVSSLLERELPAMGIRIPSPRLFRFWSLLASIQGQLLNVSTLARSLELSTTAVNHYLDVMEKALMIRRLPPYYANIRKRLVKHPKLYIRDTGLLHRLAGLTGEPSLEGWIGRGNSFEALVVEELIAAASLSLPSPRFFYYRTQAGAEVDLLIESERRLIPVEIKLGIEVTPYDTAGLRACMKDLGLAQGFLVSRGEQPRTLGHGILALPWEEVARGKLYPWSPPGVYEKG